MNYGGGRRGVNTGNIVGDPFALATISISAVSATAGVIALQLNLSVSSEFVMLTGTFLYSLHG